MQIKWLGHASFELKIGDLVLYIDPYSGEYEDKADIILISHAHHDHFNREIVEKIRKENTTIIGPSEVASQIDNCRAVSDNEEGILENIRIKTVPSYNTPDTPRPTHKKGQGIGFLIKTNEKTIYFAGDTSLIPEMKNIETDIALLPVGGTYTMNAKQAAEAARLIKTKTAIPMHYGKIVGTKDDAEYFKELSEEKGIKVRILKENEWTEI
ncbi:MBL fold metallo-hydrolase [Candidatus Woesearchaeota archaeon]|nr:MBL fold metallo-hydrolase [Candidatus Woesearchaeota archaeon]